MKKQDENAPLPGQVTIEELTTLHEECRECPYYRDGECKGNSEGLASINCLYRKVAW